MNHFKKMLKIMIIIALFIPLMQFNFVEGSESSDYTRKHLLAGYDFSGVIMENGDVWTWGANQAYQLGLGDTENRLYPVKQNETFNPKNIAEVISTDGTTHILLKSGDVYRWGKNSASQGGLSTPRKLLGNVSSVGHTRVQVLTNPHDATAFVEDGQVKVYGSNYNGQGGRGISGYGSAEKCTNGYNVNLDDRKPVLTSGTIHECSNNSDWKHVEDEVPLTNVKMVEGSTFSRAFVAVTNENEIYSWGVNYSLFAKKNNNANIESEIMKLAVGENIYALTKDKEVWEWKGANGTPVKLDIENVKDIQVQEKTVMILTEDGEVYAKGDNEYGQLSNSLNSKVTNFTKIKSNINEIGLGSHHSLFEEKSGKIFGQGWNGYRQLANSNDGVQEHFVKVENLSNISHISAEIYSSFAIKNKRDLLGWGQLNVRGYNEEPNSPVNIKRFEDDVVKLDSNTDEQTGLTGVVLKNNKSYTWGHNYDLYNGQGVAYSIVELKHNPDNEAYTPNTVEGKTYVVKDKLGASKEDVSLKDISSGTAGGIGLNLKGQLLSWGSDSGGLWGTGEIHLRDAGSRGISPKISKSFVKVKSNEKFKSVGGNSRARLALHENGDVYSWGVNTNGSIGRNENLYLPMKIQGLSNIKKVAMGESTGMALDEKGNLYSWGSNGKGQIGDGTVSKSKEIVNVSGLSGLLFEDIFSGRTSHFGITKNGDLYTWGDNRYGQLGLGGRFNRTSPRKVEGLPGPVKEVDNGEEHTIVLLENGDVYVAGANTYGQLGLNADRSVVEYQEIPFPDYITLITNDNIEKNAGEFIDLNGYVTSIVPGSPLEIKYEVEYSGGIIESGVIKNTISTLDNNMFSKRINLDDKYKVGGYTVNVSVTNGISNMTNTQSINFGVIDKNPPSSPIINVETSEWTSNNVNVSIVDGEDNESGIDFTEYKVNNDIWIKYTKDFIISSEGESKIEARTVDKAGNRSNVTVKVVKIDKSAPTVRIVPNTTDTTHEDVVLKIDAVDNHSGIKSITYLGENMTKNGDFSEGLKYWDEDKSVPNQLGGGDIALKNNYLYLADNRVSINKAEQRDAFANTAIGAEFYAEVKARGNGLLNARYAVHSGPQQTNYTQELKSDTDFDIYKFGIQRVENARDVFMVERRTKDGWIEISSVNVYAKKDITQSKELIVKGNGTYTFVVTDNAGNITTESITIDNIDKYVKLNAPTIDKFETSLIDESDFSIKSSIENLIIEDWRDNPNWSLQVSSTPLSNGAHHIPLMLNKVKLINKLEGKSEPPKALHLNKKMLNKDKLQIVGENNSRGKYEIIFDDGLETIVSPNSHVGKYNAKVTWELISAP